MISVIIPTYKREEYILSSIRSVMAQTYADWELIIVDDGSPDGTLNICRQVAREDKRIRVFPMAHSGVSAARNFGMQEAKGEYVFFMDSDDIIHPRLLEELLRVMNESNAAAASCLLKKVRNEDFGAPSYCGFDKDERVTEYQVLEGEELIYDLFKPKSKQTNAIGGKLFSVESLKGLVFDRRIRRGEDTLFVYDYALGGGSIAVCEKEWYHYRFHAESSSRLIRKNMEIDEFLDANRIMYEREEARGCYENARLVKTRLLFDAKLLYEEAHEMHLKDETDKLRKEIFKLLKKDKYKIATVKRWISFILLTYFYPLHILKERLRHRR